MTAYLGKYCSLCWFTVRVFRECLSICVCVFFPFSFEGGRRDLIVLDPADCFFMLPSKGQ